MNTQQHEAAASEVAASADAAEAGPDAAEAPATSAEVAWALYIDGAHAYVTHRGRCLATSRPTTTAAIEKLRGALARLNSHDEPTTEENRP